MRETDVNGLISAKENPQIKNIRLENTKKGDWVRAMLMVKGHNGMFFITSSYETNTPIPVVLLISGYNLDSTTISINNLSPTPVGKTYTKPLFSKIRGVKEGDYYYFELLLDSDNVSYQYGYLDFRQMQTVIVLNLTTSDNNAEVVFEYDLLEEFSSNIQNQNENSNNMQVTENQAKMGGGGITTFAIGDYAVSIRQKGGQHERDRYQCNFPSVFEKGLSSFFGFRVGRHNQRMGSVQRNSGSFCKPTGRNVVIRQCFIELSHEYSRVPNTLSLGRKNAVDAKNVERVLATFPEIHNNSSRAVTPRKEVVAG